MIKAIFFARFHSQKGPIVSHQVPPNSIVTNTSSELPKQDDAEQDAAQPLLDFPLLSPYLIPPQSLCNRLLTLRSPTSHHLVVSHPICIVDDTRYYRNEFIFNFGIVLANKDLQGRSGVLEAWKGVVRKVATVLRGLEEETQWLSEDEADVENGVVQASDSKVYALCEMVMEDLNCYGECMIPIDETTTLSLRLFPKLPETAPVQAWHVPVLLVDTSKLKTETWDLTLQLLLPFIDGVNYVSRIAQLADADVALACEAIRALVHHGCAVLLDIFSYAASYAPTPAIGELIGDQVAQEEARKYVLVPGYDKPGWHKEDVVTLLCSLRQGMPLRNWVVDRADELAGLDVRRLITFGVVKGYLYRVHKYAITSKTTVSKSKEASRDDFGKIRPYLDGLHCFDEICTKMHMSDKDVILALGNSSGHATQIIHK